MRDCAGLYADPVGGASRLCFRCAHWVHADPVDYSTARKPVIVVTQEAGRQQVACLDRQQTQQVDTYA